MIITFLVGWIASKKIVKEGDSVSCADITLKAKWETKTYKCPEGYTLSGNKCTQYGEVLYKCPSNYSNIKEINGNCIRLTNDSNYYQKTTKVCPKKTVHFGGGTTQEVQGELLNLGMVYCFYGVKTSITSMSQCMSTYGAGHWVNNKCYIERDQNFSQSCPSGYLKVDNPNDYVTNTGLNPGCFKILEKEKYCESGYVYTGGKCVKTMNATYE